VIGEKGNIWSQKKKNTKKKKPKKKGSVARKNYSCSVGEVRTLPFPFTRIFNGMLTVFVVGGKPRTASIRAMLGFHPACHAVEALTVLGAIRKDLAHLVFTVDVRILEEALMAQHRRLLAEFSLGGTVVRRKEGERSKAVGPLGRGVRREKAREWRGVWSWGEGRRGAKGGGKGEGEAGG